MYEPEIKTLRVRTDIKHPHYPAGDVLLVQPNEDLVGADEAEFTVGETLMLLIKAKDNTEWGATGRVVTIDVDAEPLLLGVRINWDDATLAPLTD